jgi:hypothetical protein
MKRLRYVPDEYYRDFNYSVDVEYMVNIAKARGYIVSPSDVRLAWEHYSDSMAASWMLVDHDNEERVWATLRPLLTDDYGE